MNISIYGAGNQRMYLEKLKIPEKYGGDAPYGGAAIAIEFAKAGHDVVLAEEDKEIMSEKMWEKVKDAGVTVVSDYTEAAKNAEIVLFHKSFKNSSEIVDSIVSNLPRDAIVANASNFSAINLLLESSLKTKRNDIGLSSMYPIAIPGTPYHNSYIIAGKSIDGEHHATEEQIKKCVDLAKSVNKEPKVVPYNIAPILADVKKYFAIVSLSGIIYICSNSQGISEQVLKNELLNILEVFKKTMYACNGVFPSNIGCVLEQMSKFLLKQKKNNQQTMPPHIDEITQSYALILLSGMIESCILYDYLDLPDELKKKDIIYTIREMEYLIEKYEFSKILEYMHPNILIKSAKYDMTLSSIISNKSMLYSAMYGLEKYAKCTTV